MMTMCKSFVFPPRIPTNPLAFILCFSRFCLAVEYLAVLFHVRRFRRAQLPLVTQAAVNATAGAIFLGIAFRFEPGRKSRVFMTWYFVSAAEAIITVMVSNFSRVLGFTRTHLMKRMSLLTIMIFGDGIIAVAQDVVIIVKTADAWSKLFTPALCPLNTPSH